MVANGVISSSATLRMPAFDVNLAGAPGFPPEIDNVLFNGTSLGNLTGSNNTWKLNEFQVPIELVRFGQRRPAGAEPIPGNNEITILIDQASGSDVNWCTAIDWVELTFRTMSPIVLVHGNGSNGEFFVEQQFVDFLRSRQLLYDHSTQLPTSSIFANAKRIADQLPKVWRSQTTRWLQLEARSAATPYSHDPRTTKFLRPQTVVTTEPSLTPEWRPR